MQPPSDREPTHPDPAMTNGAARASHPTVPAAELHQPPDQTADLVTRMVDLLVELYSQPTDSAPHTTRDDPHLRAAITRLHRLEDSLEQLTTDATPVRQAPPTAPSPDSGDRGEWVEAGMRR
jgi:hypothetical protein